MIASEPKPVCSSANMSMEAWQSPDWEDSSWNIGALGGFTDYLRHFQLQDEILHAPRGISKQVIWKTLLLGYALAITTARITAVTLSRRRVILTAVLLAITYPATSSHLQSLSSQTLYVAILVSILEVTCVARLLSLKPFGPVAAATGALLRLVTALAPPVIKQSASVSLRWQLPNVCLLAPAVFLLLFVYVMTKSHCREEKNCSSTIVQRPGCPSTTPFSPKPLVEADKEKTPRGLPRELHKKRCSTSKTKAQPQDANLRRSTRIRRPVDRFHPSSQTKPA